MSEPSDERLQEVIADSLRHHLAAGVTTVRDLGDRRFAVPTGGRRRRPTAGIRE